MFQHFTFHDVDVQKSFKGRQHLQANLFCDGDADLELLHAATCGCASLKNTNNRLMVMITGRNSTLYSEDAQGLMHQIRVGTAALVSSCACIHNCIGKYC